MGFLPEDRQLFRPADTLGQAMREVARAMAPFNTSKILQRRWRIDPSTAENVTKGQASGTTLVKAVGAERENGGAWELWDALGELLIGESRDEAEERKLQTIIAETERAKQAFEDRRRRRLYLESADFIPEVAGRKVRR